MELYRYYKYYRIFIFIGHLRDDSFTKKETFRSFYNYFYEDTGTLMKSRPVIFLSIKEYRPNNYYNYLYNTNKNVQSIHAIDTLKIGVD